MCCPQTTDLPVVRTRQLIVVFMVVVACKWSVELIVQLAWVYKCACCRHITASRHWVVETRRQVALTTDKHQQNQTTNCRCNYISNCEYGITIPHSSTALAPCQHVMSSGPRYMQSMIYIWKKKLIAWVKNRFVRVMTFRVSFSFLCHTHTNTGCTNKSIKRAFSALPNLSPTTDPNIWTNWWN